MGRLLPNDYYFKRTPRHILSDAEKEEIVHAIQRAMAHLWAPFSDDDLQFSPNSCGEKLSVLQASGKAIDRCIMLTKGYPQSRYLYRRSRLIAIDAECQKIAKETGAEFVEVLLCFMARMSDRL